MNLAQSTIAFWGVPAKNLNYKIGKVFAVGQAIGYQYDFGSTSDDFILSVCNSPRMGVCGYGGSDRYPDQFEPDET